MGCSTLPFPKIDPYVISPIETGPNQFMVVARASDYIGGEPLIRQLAINKAKKHCEKDGNFHQVTDIKNGRWANGASIDIFFKCLNSDERDYIYSKSLSGLNYLQNDKISVYKPEFIKGIDGEWFKYAETASEDYYILTNFYETASSTREVWVLYDFKPSSIYGPGSIKVLYEHICSNELIQGRIRAIKTVAYDGPMGNGKVTNATHVKRKWDKIQPFTMSDERQQLICD
ncbi:MAG: hypothetical protein CBD16_00645 [Betaproteobacteria bacterium TMED156]|nr:MAG: hypothetical protein CBD16_00645 [Betaproteobacteria bacterium TMED156]